MSETRYEIRFADDSKPYWVQIAANNEILATSETYESLQGAFKGALASGAKGPVPVVGEPPGEAA